LVHHDDANRITFGNAGSFFHIKYLPLRLTRAKIPVINQLQGNKLVPSSSLPTQWTMINVPEDFFDFFDPPHFGGVKESSACS
jgi:hypothetical protein